MQPPPVPVLSISDEDLAAYAERRLDPARRAQIEGFLACNPDLAARVMQASHLHERQRAATSRLLAQGSFISRNLRALTACIACGIAGWAVAEGLDEEGPFEGLLAAPEYVEDAVMAQRVTQVRIAMDSQVQTPRFDAAELLQAMQIRLPVLPPEWRLLDAQVYPSEEGPSISMLVETAPGRELNLFAVRANTAARSRPAMAARTGKRAAYWEVNGAAYVLSGEGSAAEILAQATRLSQAGR